MLRNIDRKIIYQEEVYRFEVRSQLDKAYQNKNKGGMWTFVNSAFFLWFLSSVVLGIVSFSYAKWDKQREIEREQRERAALVERENIQRVKKLDAEISSRLDYFVSSQYIYLIKPAEEGVRSMAVIAMRFESVKKPNYLRVTADSPVYGCLSEDGIMSLDDPNAINYKVNVYPEYANRNLRSLLLELEDVVPPQEKDEIALAYKRSYESQSLFLNKIKSIRIRKKKGETDCIHETATELKEFCEAFNLKRWRQPMRVTNEITIMEF